MLVFEDLHWADEGLLDFLDHLADWATSAPLVLLCTARPELLDRRPTWGARANAAYDRLAAAEPCRDGIARRLPAASRPSSRPSYSKPCSRARRATRSTRRSSSACSSTGACSTAPAAAGSFARDDLPLPESVQSIIAARIDALPPDEKRVLQDAAVIGRGFWPGGVAAVVGVKRDEVDADPARLERKELVRRLASTAVAGELQYSFHHALVRDVAYGQIPHAERTEQHRLAASWIESLGRREDHAETLAHHYLSALGYARGRVSPTVRASPNAPARRCAPRASGRSALSASRQSPRHFFAGRARALAGG